MVGAAAWSTGTDLDLLQKMKSQIMKSADEDSVFLQTNDKNKG